MFLGDSLTNGLFATAPELSWKEKVITRLSADAPIETIGAAISHANLTTVAAVGAVPGRLDVAIVELGTNDVGRTPIGEFRRQYQALVTRIRSQSPSALILCLGAWQANPGNYDLAIQEGCGQTNEKFISLADLFNNGVNRGPAGIATPEGISDDFHPNDRGHLEIAGRVLENIPTPL